MLYTAKSRKAVSRRQNTSNSKDSKESLKRSFKRPKYPIRILTKAQFQLRNTIENKYIKSKIKNYKYEQQQRVERQQSPSSDQMKEYSFLENSRSINLKAYHTQVQYQNSQKKCIIRVKMKDQRKSLKKQYQNQRSPLRISYLKQEKIQIFENRKTMSEEKKKQWRVIGFDWQSISKNIKQPVTSPKTKLVSTPYFKKPNQKSKGTTSSRLSYK